MCCLGAQGGGSDCRRKAAWHRRPGAGLTLAEPPWMSPGWSHGGLVRRGILRGGSALPGRIAASTVGRRDVCGQASEAGLRTEVGGWTASFPRTSSVLGHR